MPPAFASTTSNGKKLGTEAATEDVLPLTTLSSTVSTPMLLIPPPSVLRPFGGADRRAVAGHDTADHRERSARTCC